MNQAIDIKILAVATQTIAFSIAATLIPWKASTAGQEIAKCQFQLSFPSSAPSSPRSAITQKTIARIVAST